MTRMPPAVAWAGAVSAVVLLGAAVLFAIMDPAPLQSLATPWLWVWLLIWPAFAVVGGWIGLSQPHNRLAWVLLGVGLCGAGWTTAELYVDAAVSQADPWPGVPAAAWVLAWAIGPVFVSVFVFLPLLFPDGKLPSPRWRPVWRLGLAAMVLQTAAGAVMPEVASENSVANPMAVDALAGPATFIWDYGTLLTLPLMVTALGSLLGRFRRAGTVQRLQIKWIVAAITLAVIITTVSQLLMTVVGEGLDRYDAVLSLVQLAPILIVPVTIGVAVTRYRLYEIDRLISRTVSYGLLTAVLVGLYALVAVVPAALFDLDSDLLVAGATLVAAAAFGPVRRRIQGLVDRRFDRQHYDAERVVAGFRDRLRDEVDLADVTRDLQRAVATTVQPAHMSLWLGEPEAAR